MPSNLWGVFVLGLGVATAYAGPALLERLIQSRRIIRASISTVVGLILFALSYIYLFDRANCSLLALSCVINANEGMVALTALIVAVVTIWLGILSDERHDRREHEKEVSRRNSLVAAVIEESRHNLVHIACNSTSSGVVEAPQIATNELRRFVEEQQHHHLGTEFERDARAIIRNEDAMHLAGIPTDLVNAAPTADRYWRSLESFTTNNIRMLVNVYKDRRSLIQLEDRLDRAFDRLVEKSRSSGALYVTFKTSDEHLQSEVSGLRTLDSPILCWIDDKHHDGVDTFEFSVLFNDNSHSH